MLTARLSELRVEWQEGSLAVRTNARFQASRRYSAPEYFPAFQVSFETYTPSKIVVETVPEHLLVMEPKGRLVIYRDGEMRP